MKAALFIACLAACGALSSSAFASAAYPVLVKQHFEVDTLPATPPSCTLCHQTDDGGNDTVVRPFGRALLSLGAKGNDAPSLESALSQVESEGIDSDRDGVSDADELRGAADPNVGDGSTPDPLAGVTLPQTGCSVGARPSAASGWLFALALGLLARRRRSASRR